jgi:cytochrome c-type biogenesis protein CcmH/NrfF
MTKPSKSPLTAWSVRLLWIFPVVLLVLGLNQAYVAWQITETLKSGFEATARVTELEVSNRVDVTYDYVSLAVTLPGGEVIEQERLSLPHTLAPQLVGAETLEVVVRPGESQQIVVTRIAATQWRIAAINAAMCLAGALMAFFSVFAWQRYLTRRGDPAERSFDEAEAERIAST